MRDLIVWLLEHHPSVLLDADLTMTLRYAHLAPDHLAAAVETLAEWHKRHVRIVELYGPD